MKVIKSNWFCSMLIFVVGIVLCCLYNRSDVLTIIVYILGALFTATGCINIIASSMRRNKGESNAFTATVGWLAGLGGIGLGAAMLIVSGSFIHILVYVFATLLILGGLWHFFVLSDYYRRSGLPGWLYFLPLIILIGGVVLFCSASVRDNIPVAILMSGIGAIIYGITTLLEYIFSKSHAKELEKQKHRESADKSESGATANGLADSVRNVMTLTDEKSTTSE